MTGRSNRFYLSTRDADSMLRVRLLEHGEMHPMSTEWESLFYEHGKYRFAERHR